MGKTSIEWTDASWNPIVGCSEVSPGCANCYAARLCETPAYNGLTSRVEFCDEHRVPLNDGRCPQCRDANGKTFVLDMQSKVLSHNPHWTGKVRFLPERLEEPLHWKKPRRIFVCDMGDLFHEDVLDSTLVQIFATMLATPRHTYQVLTKRALRMNGFLSRVLPELWKYPRVPVTVFLPLPNVWVGVSVENQHFANERIPLLLETPAAVRWISAEPLLGPVELKHACEVSKHPGGLGRRLDWVVCGGESGPTARPMHPYWARSVRDQCQTAGVPFFFKQWGAWVPCTGELPLPVGKECRLVDGTEECGYYCDPEGPGHVDHRQQPMLRIGKKKAGRLLDGRTWDEFPAQTR